jgi:exopolysaccharide biosynthesis polyprenyl glycosylphosphotransferase
VTTHFGSAGSDTAVEGPGRSFSGPDRAQHWRRRWSGLVVITDVALIFLSTLVSILVGLTGVREVDRARLLCGAGLALLLLLALPLSHAWDDRVLGSGAEEFKRLGRALLATATILAMVGLLFMVESVRAWVFGIVPIVGALLLVARFALRKGLHRRRSAGRCMLDVLVIGDHGSIEDLAVRTDRDPHFGWRVAGACTPDGRGHDGHDSIRNVPVVGDLDAAASAARAFDLVAVARAPGWGPARLQRLAWQLEGTDTELAVDPGLMEIAGPRMHISPVDGLPLLRLSKPRFTGTSRLLKSTLDRGIAAVLLVLGFPVFLAVAIAIKIEDSGPVLFAQERVGTRGKTFRMFKFRSMCVDAEAKLDGLRSSNEGAGPLFKIARDPRITRVGEVLRKYSLDELPQLLNVLVGSMSLVGPRPPLPREVATYADDAQRRLLVRPGMTGLWQVSGRSALSWEETVRLDLRYVENWSLAMDLAILWKTFGAVVRSRGAY